MSSITGHFSSFLFHSPTVFVVRNGTRHTNKHNCLSTYGLTQSYIISFSIQRIIKHKNLQPVSKVYTKNTLLDVTPYHTIQPFIEYNRLENNTFYYDKTLKIEHFEIEDGSLVISGNIEDLWGDKSSEQPQKGSILYLLNEYYNLDNRMIFPLRGQFIYEYNFDRCQTYNTYY